MTVLSGQTIRQRGIFTPFAERSVHEQSGMSYGLSVAGYDVRVAEAVRLTGYNGNNRFMLASTVEHFTMPDDVIGIVHDKSTLARKGLTVQNTVIEPGWRGFLTLELTYHADHWIALPAGCPIAQVVFHLLDAPAERPYSGKYQDQEAGPQAARMER